MRPSRLTCSRVFDARRLSILAASRHRHPQYQCPRQHDSQIANGAQQRRHVSRYRTIPTSSRLPRLPPSTIGQAYPDGGMLSRHTRLSHPCPVAAATAPGPLSSGRDDTQFLGKNVDAASPRMMMSSIATVEPHVRIPRFSTAVYRREAGGFRCAAGDPPPHPRSTFEICLPY